MDCTYVIIFKPCLQVILFSLFINALAYDCIPRNCPRGSTEVMCSAHGAKNSCEVCNGLNCFQPPHCTPEATIKFIDEQDLKKPPVCVCDTSRNYYGKDPIDCHKKDPPCESSWKLNPENGSCYCDEGYFEKDNVCVEIPKMGANSSPQSGFDTGAVVGGCVGGLAFIIAIIVIIGLVIWYKRMSKRRKDKQYSSVRKSDIADADLHGESRNGGPSGPAADADYSNTADSDSTQSPNVVIHIENVNYITAENVQQGNNNVIKPASNGRVAPPTHTLP